MEKTKRRHFLYDHPYVGGLIALAITWLFVNLIGPYPDLLLEEVRETQPDLAVPESFALGMNYASCILIAGLSLVALLVHRMWFRKDGYKGAFTRPGLRTKEAWLVILGVLVLDVVLVGYSAVSDGLKLVMPSVLTALLSCQAGIYEEITFRAVPGSLMMRNGPTYKRMWMTLVVTSLVFGGIHMTNMAAGATFEASALQSVNAFALGMLMGAIYLRSGNILLTMVLHAMHDLIALTLPTQVTGVITETEFTAMDVLQTFALATVYIAAAIYLVRKSKWEEIKATWANIWAE